MTTEMVIMRGLVIGAVLCVALRHGADMVAGLMLNACRGGERETWLRRR